jgi:hypothetical protein
MVQPSVKISFYAKEPTTCPVCGSQFYREEMLSGGGRLIAKDITDELRRIYQPSKKAGEIFPLVYPVTVCPNCYYAAYPDDFPLIKGNMISMAAAQKTKRLHDVKLIFPVLDFRRPRNLFTGAASYLLAMNCYSFHTKERAPTFKKALSSLRAAWLFDDLDRKYRGQNYDIIRNMLYKKAILYYERTIEYSQTGKERIDGVKNYGPDLDKNFGFEGVLYISTLLVYKYGDEGDVTERIKKLEGSKRVISKVFGMGKSSKSKPTLILDISRELYDKIGEKIAQLKESG